VTLTDYGALLATIPATVSTDVPTIALLAHVDTAPQFSGTNVKPIVHRNYNGQDIVLPDDPSQVLSPKSLPYLTEKVGDDIVTASGTTLLGADDKAGIAIIMARRATCCKTQICPTAVSASASHPTRRSAAASTPTCPPTCKPTSPTRSTAPHLGEIVYETFSADAAQVTVKGVSIHPGWAKDKLVNAAHLAAKIVDTLPQAHADAGDDLRAAGLSAHRRHEWVGGRMTDEHSSCATSSAISGRAGRTSAEGLCGRAGRRAARPRSPAPSPPNIATCATGWRTTCARSNWRVRRAARSASRPSPCPCAVAPMARG
jgi:hypothetical protein